MSVCACVLYTMLMFGIVYVITIYISDQRPLNFSQHACMYCCPYTNAHLYIHHRRFVSHCATHFEISFELTHNNNLLNFVFPDFFRAAFRGCDGDGCQVTMVMVWWQQ